MRCLNVTPAAASAELTIAASRISEKGRTFDSLSDSTFSEIHRRVAWGMVGLLAGTGIDACNPCNHQFFTKGGRHLSIPSSRSNLWISECHSWLSPFLSLTFSAVIMLIADLDRPHQGLLQVDQTAMIDLQNSVKAP